MKTTTKIFKFVSANIKFIWIATAIILTISVAFYHYNLYLNNIYTAKIQILEEEKTQAEAQAKKKSDIELLEFYAAENAAFAKQRLEDITYHKEEITKLQSLYETELLTQRCYEAQIDRKINWLEYNLDYCKDEANLDQYRTKKY